MKVLVIGGSGLFGRKTVGYSLQDPAISEVVSMDLTPPRDWFMQTFQPYAAKFHFVRGDLLRRIPSTMSAVRLRVPAIWRRPCAN